MCLRQLYGFSHLNPIDIDNQVRGVKAMPKGITFPPNGIIKTQLMEIFVRRDGKSWIVACHNVDVKPAK